MIQEWDGVSHTVEVTAATLYEAVAQGLAAIRGNERMAGIAQDLNVVEVSVADVRVEHEVKLMDFTKWLVRARHRFGVSNGQLLLRLFDFRACLLDTAFDEFGLHFGVLSS